LKVFDAHCDTIRKILEGSAEFSAATGMQVTLPAMLHGGVRGQVFACWASAEQYPGREFKVALDMVKSVRSLVNTYSDHLVLVTEGSGLQEAIDTNKVGVLIGLEGAIALQDDAENLHSFYDLGLRVLTLAWSDNAFCGSVFGNGAGLSKEGQSLVNLCEELGVIIDVSHASDHTFQNLLDVTKHPFIASHSNCRAVCPNPRNLTDEMIEQLSDRGGVMGINMGSGFLVPAFFEQQKGIHDKFFRVVELGKQSFDEAMKEVEETIAQIPRPNMRWIVTHVEHAIRVGGENCVGFGSDFDGVESTPAKVDSCAAYPCIVDLLYDSGLNWRQVEKVCWGNFKRVFSECVH